jgi:exosortase/archaeosortase family protein
MSTRNRLLGPARFSVVVLLLVVTVSLVVFQQDFRNLEATLAAKLLGIGGTPVFAAPGTAIVWFGLGQRGAYGLEISPECSAAFLIAPFTFIGSAMLWRRRLSTSRVAVGVVLTAVLLMLGNQMRVGLIAYLIQVLGLKTGYEWGHLILGSLLSIVFIAGSMAMLIWVVSSGRLSSREATS